MSPEVKSPDPGKTKGNLDSFWRLSIAKTPKARIDASTSILKTNSLDVEYTLHRLLRGLASTKTTTRQGYYACLCEFLRQQEVDYDKIVTSIQTVLKVVGGRGEEAEFLLAQLLSFSALLRSGKASSSDQKMSCLDQLLEIGGKRHFFLLATVRLVVEHFIANVSDEDFTASWSKISESINFVSAELTMDSLYLLLEIFKHRPGLLDKDFLLKNLGEKKLMCKKSLEAFTGIIMNSNLPLVAVKSHPVLPALVEAVVKTDTADKFWTTVIPFFGSTLNNGQLAYHILLEMVRLAPAMVTGLLTHHTLDAGLQLVTRNHGDVVVSFFAEVVKSVEQGKMDRLNILKKLMAVSVKWDKTVSGGTVMNLLKGADADTVKTVASVYSKCVLEGGQPGERIWSCQQLAKLVGHPAAQGDTAWRLETLKLLMSVSLLSQVGPIPLSRESRDQLRDVFYRGLDSRSKSLSENVTLLLQLVRHADGLVEGEQLARPLEEVAKTEWRGVMAVVGEIEDMMEKASEKKEMGVFMLLFCQMALQLLINPVAAIDVLAELKPVFFKFKEKSDDGDREGGEPKWVEVVVEILLSLLSLSQHLLRSVVSSVFSIICQHMTIPALDSIMAVVNPGEEEQEEEEDDDGSEEEDGGNDNEEEDDDEDEDEEEMESDEEVEDEDDNETKVDDEVVAKVRAALGEHADDEEESGNDIDMDDIPDEEMAKMDAKLVDVFKQLGGKKSNLEKKKEKLTKLAMMHFRLRALDLLDVYLGHQPPVSHVLHLVPGLISGLETAMKTPDQQTLADRLKAVVRKVTNVRKNCVGGGDVGSDQLVQVMRGLVEMACNGSSVVTALSAPIPLFPQLCGLILRLSLQAGTGVEQMEEVYNAALVAFRHKKQCVLPPTFFQLAMGIDWSGSWKLAEGIAEAAFDKKVRQFRRTQSLMLLAGLFRSRAVIEADRLGRLVELTERLVEAAVEQLNSSVEEEENVKIKYMSEILNTMRAMKTSPAGGKIDWENFKNALSKFGAKLPRNKELKKSFNRLSVLFGIKSRVQNKEKGPKAPKKETEHIAENGAPEFGGKKKKKKKRKNKETLKKKKEIKYEEASAELKENIPSFAGIVVKENMNFAKEDELASPEVKDGKIKKKKRKISKSEDSSDTPVAVKKGKKIKA